MLHNDVLRSVRYMLDVDDESIAQLIALGGGNTRPTEVMAYLLRDDEPGYEICSDRVMGQFLDGLILHRRGPREGAKGGLSSRSAKAPMAVTNNAILKALRIAFELKEDDLLAMMKAAGFEVSRPELSALFRNPAHHNYRPCGDQFLRNFLKGLTAYVKSARASGRARPG